MAKRKLSISNLKNVPANIAKEAAKAMDGIQEKTVIEPIIKEQVKKSSTEKQKNRKTGLQKNRIAETRKDNLAYKTVRINKQLHHKLKLKALESEMKITDYIEQILAKAVK